MRSFLPAAVAALVVAAGCVRASQPGVPGTGPPLIYSADRDDSWNRIFALLFTRTVEVSKTDEFADAGPFTGPASTKRRLAGTPPPA